MMTVQVIYLFLAVFSALYSWTKMSVLEENPCNSLPSEPEPEQLADANFYCKDVHSRFMLHPFSKTQEYCKSSHSARCESKEIRLSVEYRCTVAIENYPTKAWLRLRRYRVDLKVCVEVPKFWSEAEEFHVKRNTPSEELQRRYIQFILDNDYQPSSWGEKTENAAAFSIQGLRPSMEVTFVVKENIPGLGMSYFAVFDGHAGEFTSNYARDYLLANLVKMMQQKSTASGSPRQAPETTAANVPLSSKFEEKRSYFVGDKMVPFEMLLKEVILSTDKVIVAAAKADEGPAGSTALVAIISESRLIMANVGDSRGVMCDSMGKAVPISIDHKPFRKSERTRIKAAGGTVEFDGTWRVDGILAMSRALGDYHLKEKSHLIADPDILIFNLCHYEPQFLVLATDGVWDVLSNTEVVTFIKARFNENYFGAKSLAYFAHFRGSKDNITVVVINLKDKLWTCSCPMKKCRTWRGRRTFGCCGRSSRTSWSSRRSERDGSSTFSTWRKWSFDFRRKTKSEKLNSPSPLHL